MKIPFVDLVALHQGIASELEEAWDRVMSSGCYILGQEVEAFEEEFASYCGGGFCIGVGNGLDALALILRAMDIGRGDEVIVPGNTFIATWLAVSHVGAIPVPVEPDEVTYNIDPDRIERSITRRTRAVIAVDLYGRLAESESILRIAHRHRLKVVEDAAQAHGARLNGFSAGGWADAAGFSFFPTKNLGCLGDGGAVVTRDAKIADKVRLLRNYGSRTKYYNDVVGFNSRLDPIQAVFLRVKLPYLDSWNAHRQQIARAYNVGLSNISGVKLPQQSYRASDHVWHLYVIRHCQRDALQRFLDGEGIETLMHYPIPPHLSNAYAPMGLAGHLPITEKLAKQALSLPMGPHISFDDAARIVSAVQHFPVQDLTSEGTYSRKRKAQ